jgi:hypothetical protein
MKGNLIRLRLLLFIPLFSFCRGYSQTYKISAGIAISPSIATSHFPEASMQQLPRASFGAGIDSKFNFCRNFSLVTGVYYLDRGFMTEEYLVDSTGNLLGTFRLSEHEHYLSVPLMVLFQPNHFFFGIGPNFNFYLNPQKNPDGITEEIESGYIDKKFLLGSQFQLGYEVIFREKISCYAAVSVNATGDFVMVNYGLDLGMRYVFY